MVRFALGVSMNNENKALVTKYLDNTRFLAEASEHDNIDDAYWIVKAIEKEQENLKKLLNLRGINLSELNSLVVKYMEIEETLADLLAEKEEIREKLFERGYEI